MKSIKKMLFSALTVVAIGVAGVGTAAMASAENESLREFNAKYDTLIADYNVADLSSVTVSGDADLGEKPFLRVGYTQGVSVSPDDAIYKQGTPAGEQGAKNLVLTMRAPNGDVELSELYLGARYNDSTPIYAKTLDNMLDPDGENLPALTDEWQKYVISFTASYEDEEVFEGTDIKLNAGTILGFHLYAGQEEEGMLDISEIYYTSDDADTHESSRIMLNTFLGGETVDQTAKATHPNGWWCGSSEGFIVKRAVTLHNEATLSMEFAEEIGGYEYLVVEATGDVVGATASVNGQAAMSVSELVTVEGTLRSVTVSYNGPESVAIERMFLTNLQDDEVATRIPVIDPTTTQKLEDFNVAQSKINGDYEEMSTMPQMQAAGLYYRLSYKNETMVSIADGALKIDATALAQDDYINFKYASQTYGNGQYLVVKARASEGATLDNFRFSLGSNDAYGSVIYANQMMAGNGLKMAGLDASNPYVTEDGWYYLVIDLELSGFGTNAAGFNGMDMYYSGTGILEIDEIFFAERSYIINETETDSRIEFTPSAEGYEYAGYIYLPNDGTAQTMSMDITVAEGTDLSGIRLEFAGVGVRWASENAEGSLVLTDGRLLSEAEFVPGVTQTVTIDLAASGLNTAFADIHVHTNGIATGGFVIENLKLTQKTLSEDLLWLDEETAFETDTEIHFTPSGEGYEYAGYLYLPSDGSYDVLIVGITVAEGTDLSGVRLEFAGVGVRWASENAEGSLVLTDGRLLSEVEFVPDETTFVMIDLAASGLKTAFQDVHVHTNGTGTGAFEMVSLALCRYLNLYPLVIEDLPVYETPDTTAPVVTITTKTSATEGDSIVISYEATDDVTAELEITVTVKKDGAEVQLPANNTIVAEVGVYTVTVTARDEAGNENSDTIQITVTEKQPSDSSTDSSSTSSSEKKGCGVVSFGSTLGGGLGGLLLLASAAFAVTLLRKKRA